MLQRRYLLVKVGDGNNGHPDKVEDICLQGGGDNQFILFTYFAHLYKDNTEQRLHNTGHRQSCHNLSDLQTTMPNVWTEKLAFQRSNIKQKISSFDSTLSSTYMYVSKYMSKILAAFQWMHLSPAKYSYVWPSKAWLPDRQTDTGQSDKYVPLCF